MLYHLMLRHDAAGAAEAAAATGGAGEAGGAGHADAAAVAHALVQCMQECIHAVGAAAGSGCRYAARDAVAAGRQVSRRTSRLLCHTAAAMAASGKHAGG